jgi:hypothetical protein
VCGSATGFGGAIIEIVLVNATAYKYYGIGSVASGSPYYSADWSITTQREYPLRPFGSSVYAANQNAGDNWKDLTYSPVISHSYMNGAATDHFGYYIGDPYPWTKSLLNAQNAADPSVFGQGAMFAIPQVSASPGVPAQATYKYWRIRPSSSFWGANTTAVVGAYNWKVPGNGAFTTSSGVNTNTYFQKLPLMKLGLYRDTATAVADTFGLSPNNYVRQSTNSLYGSWGGLIPVGTGSRDELFNNISDWNSTARPGAVLYGDTNKWYDFSKDNASIRVRLDVEGPIGAIRFPDYLWFYAYTGGGGLILEASTAAEPDKWVTMVATTASGATLGRDGLVGTGETTAYSSSELMLPMMNTLFSVAPCRDTYTPPTTVSAVTVPGLMLKTWFKTVGLTVRLSGVVWTPGSNKKEDFSVHFEGGSQEGPVFYNPALGTRRGVFNCVVTAYDATTGVLTFDYCPTAWTYADVGPNGLVVVVRSGEGTGVTMADIRPPSGSFVWVRSMYRDLGTGDPAYSPSDGFPDIVAATVPALTAGVKRECSFVLFGFTVATLTPAKLSITLESGTVTNVRYTYTASTGSGTLLFDLTHPTVGPSWVMDLQFLKESNSTWVARVDLMRVQVKSAVVGFTCTVAPPVYTLTGASAALAVTEFAAPCGIALYASKAASDPAPAALVASRVALSSTGTATASAAFPSAGQWYVYAQLSAADGYYAGPSFVQATGGAVTVVDYALPTLEAWTAPTLFDGVASTLSLVLSAGANTAALSAANMTATLVAPAGAQSAVATSVTYVPGTRTVGLTVTPSSAGQCTLELVISAPVAGSSFTVTRSAGAVAVSATSAFPFPTAVALVSPQTMVRYAPATVTLALTAPVRASGTALVGWASTGSDASPASIGTYDVSPTGTVSFPFTGPAVAGPVYFYVKAESRPGSRQASFLVTSGPVTVRDFVFPTSFVVTSATPIFVEGEDAETLACKALLSVDGVSITATPSDGVAQATITLSYGTTAALESAVAFTSESSALGTLGADGKGSPKLRFSTGDPFANLGSPMLRSDATTVFPPVITSTFYLFARVTAPGHASYRDISCAVQVPALLSPLWPSSSVSTTNTFNPNATPGNYYYLGSDYFQNTRNLDLYYWNWFYNVYSRDGGGLYSIANAMKGHLSAAGNFPLAKVLNPYDAAPRGFGSTDGFPIWFIWKYTYPIAVKRFVLTGPLDPTAQFIFSGWDAHPQLPSYSNTSCKVKVTVLGSSLGSGRNLWTKIDIPVACQYYAFQQVVGVVGDGSLFLVLGN